jgi:hypothetical protein
MATTPKGYPYPLGTDRVMDGDDVIHELAEAVDTKTGVSASGTAITPVPSGLNNPTNVTVTFPVGLFTAPPAVVTTAIGTVVRAGTQTATATNVIVWAEKLSGGLIAMSIYWQAHQH